MRYKNAVELFIERHQENLERAFKHNDRITPYMCWGYFKEALEERYRFDEGVLESWQMPPYEYLEFHFKLMRS